MSQSMSTLAVRSNALSLLMSPLAIGHGSMAAVAGLVAIAFEKGGGESEAYNKAIILTGNYAQATSARLTAHEYAIEMMMATWLSTVPPRDAEAWLKEFRDRANRSWVRDEPLSIGDMDATRIVRDAATFIERLTDKVSDRLQGR